MAAHGTNAPVQFHALYALAYLCTQDGTVPILIYILSQSCCYFIHICFRIIETMQKTLSDKGLVDLVMNAMQNHPTDLNVTHQAIQAIAFLCKNNGTIVYYYPYVLTLQKTS